jgi:rhodanese-related sulfurtransferase
MTRLHLALALAAAVMAAAAGAADLASPMEPRARRERTGFIAAPELAARIMRGDARLRLFDLRPAAAYQQFHIPTALLAAPGDLARMPLAPETDVVLYGDDTAALSAAIGVMRTRSPQVLVLREGLSEWLGRVQEPRLAVDATPEERAQFDRAVTMSRFFGGVPLAGVPRPEVPTGYWTGMPRSAELLEAAALQSVAMIRRRGC